MSATLSGGPVPANAPLVAWAPLGGLVRWFGRDEGEGGSGGREGGGRFPWRSAPASVAPDLP